MILVVCALEREAAAVRTAIATWPPCATVQVAVTGLGAVAAARQAREWITASVRLVISAGIAGGLNPALPVGAVVVPQHVLDSAGTVFDCRQGEAIGWLDEVAWSDEVGASCRAAGQDDHLGGAGRPYPIRLLTASHLVASVADKAHYHHAFAADAVDLEAAAVAAVCVERGVPFRAIKAISDDAGTALPPELSRIAPDGVPVGKALIGALVRRPSLLGDLLRLHRHTAHALQALQVALRDRFNPARR